MGDHAGILGAVVFSHHSLYFFCIPQYFSVRLLGSTGVFPSYSQYNIPQTPYWIFQLAGAKALSIGLVVPKQQADQVPADPEIPPFFNLFPEPCEHGKEKVVRGRSRSFDVLRIRYQMFDSSERNFSHPTLLAHSTRSMAK